MKKIGLLGYGETGFSALTALLGKFSVSWVIVPEVKEGMQNTDLVEELAKKNNIVIHKVKNIKDLNKILKKDLSDGVVISSFNQIIPSDMLQKTKFINVHHGDLPRFRGRANVNWAIINGRTEIGLSIHEAVPDLDAGNIYAQYSIKITKEDTVREVYGKINKVIENKLALVVDKVLSGYKGQRQQGRATYCCTRLPQDGIVDWENTTVQIGNLIRGLTHPFPGAFSFLDGERIYIWDYELPNPPRVYEGRIPGRVIEIHQGKGVEILTGDGSLIIKQVTYKGRRINASQVVSSVKKTFGINQVELYEYVQKMKEK